MTLILIFPPPQKKMKKMKLFYCFEFKMRIFCIYTPLLFIVLQIHKSVLFQIYCKILKVWCIYAPEICTGGNQNSAFYKNSEQSKIETVFFKKKKIYLRLDPGEAECYPSIYVYSGREGGASKMPYSMEYSKV